MRWKPDITRIAAIAAEAAAETLWPTRCALCDTLGDVLCERCRLSLPFVDRWRACPKCGSPFGLVQCDLCNPVALERLGVEQLPFVECASAVSYTGETGQIVRVFKDQGEQRLATDIACLMSRAISPDWTFDAVTFVPATLAAVRYRGYDHAELLASALSARLGLICVQTLNRPKTRDQRSLGGAGRVANLAGSFTARGHERSYRSLLLVDDVFTTGATLCAASRALKDAGVEHIRCLTFARA